MTLRIVSLGAIDAEHCLSPICSYPPFALPHVLAQARSHASSTPIASYIVQGTLVVATWTGACIVTELPTMIDYEHEFRRSLMPFDLEFHHQLT